jgi:hypothetical protein
LRIELVATWFKMKDLHFKFVLKFIWLPKYFCWISSYYSYCYLYNWGCNCLPWLIFYCFLLLVGLDMTASRLAEIGTAKLKKGKRTLSLIYRFTESRGPSHLDENSFFDFNTRI